MSDVHPPDHQVREEVLDPRKSFIVEAPAGSGKTELLIQRYLRLLAEVDEPESVLAITFTRKAAGEMRRRVIVALREAQEDVAESEGHRSRTRELAQGVLRRDEVRGWRLLENAERLQIRTIDSLCDSMVRRLPWVAQFGAMPGVVEDASALYQEAANRTIELLGGGDEAAAAMAELLRRLDNNVTDAVRLLAFMLNCRDQWLRHVLSPEAGSFGTEQVQALRRSLESSLGNAVRYELRALQQAALSSDMAAELMWLARFAGGNAAQGSPLKLLQDLNAWPGAECAHLPTWRALRRLLLTKSKALRKTVSEKQGFPSVSKGPRYRQAKQKAETFLEKLQEQEHAEFVALLARLDIVPDPAYAEEDWRFLQALLQALPLAVAQLRETFRRAGQVDFSEITQAARAAIAGLKGSPLELAPGAPLMHLLVDEYQDTSVSQQELFKAMMSSWRKGDGRTLFVVGDPRQSIYRFRQAEVALFQQARKGTMAAFGLETKTLRANFRSQAGLVHWVNDSFRAILRKEDSARGAVGFGEPAEAVHVRLDGEPVSILSVADDAEHSEAEHVCQVVRRERNADSQSRIAILVRTRAQLGEIVEKLNAEGIAFRSVNIDPLASRQVVRDLDSLARALVHPGDRAAWLGVLRAPWCGLKLADLCLLCENRAGRTVWELLQERAPLLAPEAEARVKRVQSILSPLLARRGRTGLRQLVEAAWNRLGGPACLAAGQSGKTQLREAMAYLHLLQESEVGGEWKDREVFEAQLEELYAPPSPEDDIRLEIMTIHKAKGLEFDVVILPSLHRGARRDENKLLYWEERVPGGEAELILGPYLPFSTESDGTITAYLKALEREREEQESRRLLYVAATRAKRRLYLLGKPGIKRSNALQHILCEVDHIASVFQQQAGPPRQQENVPKRQPMVLRRLQLAWQPPPPPQAVRWKAPGDEQVEEREHTFEWVSDPLRHVGTVVHRYLKEIATEGPESWNDAKIGSAGPAIRAALFQLGVVKDLERSVAEVQTALREMLQDTRGRWILGRQQEARNEFEISGVLEGRVYRLRIDRTFVEADGTRWIIDYKTARHSGGSLEEFLDSQCDKYRPDLQRYARLMSAYDGKPVRLALYFPLLNSWREVESAAASPLPGG